MPIIVSGIPAILAGGIRETTQTVGTGTYQLDGARTIEGITYRTFVAGVGNGNATVYTVRSGSQFETAIGTVTAAAPATLTRQVILESSNANAAVSLGRRGQGHHLRCAGRGVSQPAGPDHQALKARSPSLKAKSPCFICGTRQDRLSRANRTFTPDAGLLVLSMWSIVGGGGAGGGTQATGPVKSSAGGGGGGGEYAEGWFTRAQIRGKQNGNHWRRWHWRLRCQRQYWRHHEFWQRLLTAPVVNAESLASGHLQNIEL